MMKFLFTVLLVLCVEAAHAATYYVSTTGHDTNNDCTEAQSESTPKRTINGAIACTTQFAGDDIFVAAGTYTFTSGAYINAPKDGAASNYTVIKGDYQGTRARLQGPGTINGTTDDQANGTNGMRCDPSLAATNCTYIRVEGFEIDHVNTGAFIWGSATAGFGHHIEFINNIFHDTSRQAILGHSGSSGFLFTGVVIRGNEFYNIGKGTPGYGPGMNTIYDPGSEALIERNVFHNLVAGVGIWHSGALIRNVVVRNNVFYEIGRYDIDAWGAGSGGPRAIYQAVCGGGHEWYNNIVYNSGFTGVGPSPSGDFKALWILNAGSLSNCQSQVTKIYNNSFYNLIDAGSRAIDSALAGALIRNNVAFTGSTTMTGLGTFSHNQTTNPSYEDPANGNFSLQAGSTAINSGTAADIPSGRLSSGTPDKGAHETIPTPGSAFASGNFVDVSLPIANVPVLPAVNQTTWAVKFLGIPRTVIAASKFPGSDTVVRIQFDGLPCSISDTITIDYAAGNVTDSALIGGTKNQKLHSFSNLAVDVSQCGGSPPSDPGDPYIIYELEEVSGTTADDTSGNTLDGTHVNTPTLGATGQSGLGVLYADQGTQYTSVPFGSGFDLSENDLSICVGVVPTAGTETANRIVYGPPHGSGQRLYISRINGTWTQGVQNSGNGTNTDFPVVAGPVFLCQILNGTTSQLYVNAVAGTSNQSIKAYSPYTLAGNLVLGKASGDVSASSGGHVIDFMRVYQAALTPQEVANLYQLWLGGSSPPPPTSSREQKGHKFQRPFKKAGAAEDLRGLDEDGRVSRGGYVDVVIQLDCTADDCPSFAPRIHRSIDGGATYAQINDVCGVICFIGTSTNTDLVSADVTCCLTGALTANNGPTNFTSSAVPNITLSQDSSITLRYKLKVDASATPGQEIYLKIYDQNGNELEGGYTPSLGAKLTVKDYGNGGGF